MKKTPKKIPQILPVLTVKNAVLFPNMIMPFILKDEAYVQMAKEIMAKDKLLVVAMFEDEKGEDADSPGFHRIGTIGLAIKTSKSDEGTVLVVQGLSRANITEVVSQEPYYRAKIQEMKEIQELDDDLIPLTEKVLKLFKKVVKFSAHLPDQMVPLAESTEDPGPLADMIVSTLNIEGHRKQEILKSLNVKQRLKNLIQILKEEIEFDSMEKTIQRKVKKGIDKTQREFYLKEQLKAIKKELGLDENEPSDIQDLRERLEGKNLPEAPYKVADKEINKLTKMNPSSAEYTVSLNYLDWILELPWSESTPDKLNIKKAERVLNKHHYDLEKVKKRILEYLAVRKLNPDHKGPILCLVGPPGTGKTSLGRSVAEALGRQFVRISLGGVRDEAEVRGHRRTYVGSLPGRIIQGLKKAESNNPVFMLDEVDKIGMDFRGDPSAALLEALDPEQNFSFSDHYLEIEFDLSRVMFITTANQLDPIPPPLLDRMEVLELSGYTEEEKIKIANKFLIPRQIKEHGLDSKMISFRKAAVQKIIREYTREAGLRNLEREIGSVCRGLARRIAEGENRKFVITAKKIYDYLGIHKFTSDMRERSFVPGVATGMAWTPAGGDILFVEATMMPGQKSLVLTGQLGDVMKESAQAALSYLRSKANNLGISEDFFDRHDLHIHVPAGAIPKDGPSAGVTMLTALASLLTCRPIKADLAMTGEVTLRGSILPVGGIKEKILAANRSGIKEVILPERNKKDLEEIPDKIKERVHFHLVNKMEDVLDLALDEPVGATCA